MTWAGQFRGFTVTVSVCSVLLFRSPAAVASFASLLLVLGPVSGRIDKMKKAGRVSRLQSPDTFVLVFIEVPAAYLTVLAMAIFSLVMLTMPLNWRMIARIQTQIEKAESAAPKA